MSEKLVSLSLLSSLVLARAAAAEPTIEPANQARSTDSHLSLRGGVGHFAELFSERAAEGWSPAFELAYQQGLGMLHVGVTHFSDDVKNQVDEYERRSFTVITTGVRATWRPMPRVVLAAGLGVIVTRERDHDRSWIKYTELPLVDAMLAIEVVRFGPVSLEVFDRVGFGVLNASSLFGMGVTVAL